MKLHRWRNVACLLSLVLAVSITPVSAANPQRVERAGRDVNIIESSTGPAIIQTDQGTIIINNIQGIDPEKYGAIAKELGVTEQALKNFFAIIEQQNVSLKDLDAKLREIAEHYKTLLSSVRAPSSDDPEVTRLRNEAETALKAGEFARAEGLLNEASAKDIATIQALKEQQTRLQTALKQRQLSAAAAMAANGDLKNTQLAYVEAAAYYRQAVELLPDDEPLTLARYLNAQGTALGYAGQYAEASLSLEKALAIHEKVLGPDHPATATSLSNLGYLLKAQGKLGEAQPYYARALAIREKVLEPDHPDTASSRNNLGTLLQAQGKLGEAQPYYARALAILEKVLRPDHPDTASSRNNLGTLHKEQGKLAEALPYVARALAIREKVLGPDHPTTATSLNNLAELYRVQGRYTDALSFNQRALAIQEKTLGPEHDDTLSTMNTSGFSDL